VRSKAEALERVSIGDVATYDHELELFNGSIGTARASTTGRRLCGRRDPHPARKEKKTPRQKW